jgi:hypothetical protein
MTARSSGFAFLFVLLGSLAWSPSVEAQQASAADSGERLNVFLDCDGRECFTANTFFRTEIDWVNWVRGREDSDVHVILTTQTTGSGGKEYQLDFIGREALEGAEDQLYFRSLGTDVEQEELDGVTTVLAVGLARFAALGGRRGFVVFEALAAEGIDPDARVLGAQEVNDPWNLWVFDVGASGTLDWSDTRDTERISGDFTATRTTPTWKFAFRFGADRNVVETLLSDSSVFSSSQTDWAAGSHLAYSIADHWSVGVISSFARLPRENQRLRAEVTPALEYSVFPYEEANRKTLTTRYAIGPTYRDYFEETVFEQIEETRWEQSLQLRYSHRQPWGDGSASVTASHILDDVKKYNVTLRGNVSFRIARGLSLNTGGNISRVTDQIYLSAGGEIDEEILLNLRTRASNKNWGFNVGFSYRFGSPFNNVVNNRFARGFGDFFGFGG